MAFPPFILLGHLTFAEGFSQLLSPPMILMIYVLFIFVLGGIAADLRSFLSFSFVLTYAVAAGVVYEFHEGQLDVLEFAKSFAPFSILCLFILISVSYPRASRAKVEGSLKLMAQLGCLHSSLLLLQFLEMNIVGSTTLLNPFGPFSKIGPYGTFYGPVVWDTIYRPNGFFSEPSAAAWFTGICLAACLSYNLLSKKPVTLYVSALLVGIASTFSLSGVVDATAVIGAWLLLRSYRPVRLGRAVLVTAMACGIILAALAQTDRLQEYQRPGSSTYVRVVAPALLASDVLFYYPLGLPLGQWAFVASRPYFIQNEALQQNDNLDNGLFVILTYLGWLGVFILLATFRLTYGALQRKNPGSLLLIAVVMAVAQSGALWTPLYIIMISYSIIVVRSTDESAFRARYGINMIGKIANGR
jgi:hypothetical protein